MLNFCIPKADAGDEACLSFFCLVLVFCAHHFLAGVSMVPVVWYGWAGAGSSGQLAFIVAGFADVAITIFDLWQMLMCLLFPKQFAWLGPKQPLSTFIVIGVLHHPLSLCMGVPMLLHYASLPYFHEIAVSLLLAAGICFLSGSYKFTVDTTTPSGFYQFKCIVMAQFVTIMYSRGYIWFTRLFSLIMYFRAEGAM